MRPLSPPSIERPRAPQTWSAALGALALCCLFGCVPGVDRQGESPSVEVQLGAESAPLPAALRRSTELNGPALRVLLRHAAQGLKIACPGGLRLRDPESGSVIATLPARGHARLGASAGQLAYNGRGTGLSFALVEPLHDGDSLKAAGHRYRGSLGLQASGDQLLLINVVGLEDYLKGVLPSEIPSDWPLEAQKAQAVAARSFALAHRNNSKQPWDVDDSVSSQVYKGLDAERPLPSQAVDETRDIVLSFRGKIIEAFFHSNSGGYTADVAEVWGSKIDYLQGVLDSYSIDQQHYRWSATIPRDQAEHALVKAGLWDGYLEEIVGRDKSDSSRWLTVDLYGHGQRKRIKAQALRQALGVDRLRSTHFGVRVRGDDFVFDGRGWGHGVGLSQEGAGAQAKLGWRYDRILRFYYPGTRLARLSHG